MKPKPVVYALIEYSSKTCIALENENIVDAVLLCRYCRRKSSRTSAYNYNIKSVHFAPHIFPESISDPFTFLHISSIGIPVSRERISIVLDVQKPA